MTLDEIVRRFEATRSGAGYMARCPVHEDDKPSLGLSQQGDKILIHCFTGCSIETILQAKKLTLKDLFVTSNGNGHHAKSSVVATYTYRDLQGEIRYRKQRTVDKQFFFSRLDESGGWIASAKQNGGKPVMQGVERFLYRLHDLREHSEGSDTSDTLRIFICEGEKDVDRLWSIGLPSTSNDNGASDDGRKPKWTGKLTQQLKACGVTSVVCLPDSDPPGFAHMQAIAASCTAAGIDARIVNLPGDHPKGYDVSNWCDEGHTAAELVALAEVADLYTPSTVEPAPKSDVPALRTYEPCTLEQAHAVVRRWFGDSYDMAAFDAMLATMAAEQLDGDPVWLLLITGPGGAKTETLTSASGGGALITSTIASEGALLSGSSKREKTKEATGGLLRKIGSRGVLVIKDVTTTLSMNREARAAVLAALREIYDGRWERNLGSNGGITLTWTGRIAVMGAVTTAWDTAHTVVASMGDRFVLIRIDSTNGH